MKKTWGLVSWDVCAAADSAIANVSRDIGGERWPVILSCEQLASLFYTWVRRDLAGMYKFYQLGAENVVIRNHELAVPREETICELPIILSLLSQFSVMLQ